MALFTRDPTKKVAKAYANAKSLVEAVEKGPMPMGNAVVNGSTTISYVPGQPYNFGPGNTGNPSAGQVVPLPRQFDEFGNVMGPAFPLLPAAIDDVLDSSGRPLPRLYQYRIAENLDITFENQPWNVLRALVETCDIVHRSCEVRISDITRMDTSWSLTDECINKIMVDQNVAHSAAAKIGREKYGEMLSMLDMFWQNPYPQTHRGFDEWITEFMWNHLTYDGTPVYCRFKLNGKPLGFELIDPSTIKVLLDNRGGRPLPPAPAFQQILWGFPRGEFISDPEGTDDPDKPVKNLYDGAGRHGEFKTDQLSYFKRNTRSWSAYGYSCVEQAIPAATLYLERQAWMRSEYQTGSMAAGYIEAPSDKIDIKNISAWNRVLNDTLAGQTGQRHRMQYIPEGSKVTFSPEIDSKYRSDYDEFIIKRIAAVFGVSPQVLGIVPRAGLGGGKGAQEGEAENSETVSQRPMLNFLTDMVNSLSRRYLGADNNVTFVFNDMDSGSQGDLTTAQANQIMLFSGQTTLNDIQEKAGRPSFEMPEADEPFLVTGNTIQFLSGLIADKKAAEEASNGASQAPVGQAQSSAQEAQSQDQGNDNGQGQVGTPQAGVDTSKGAELEPSVTVDLVTAEIVTFNKFLAKRVKIGKWRDFAFTHVDIDKAGILNYEGRVLVEQGVTSGESLKGHPKISKLKALEAKYGPAILAALGVSGVAAAITQAMRHAGSSDLKTIVDAAVRGHVSTNADPAAKELQTLYTEAGKVGADATASQLGGDIPLNLPSVQTLIDKAHITIKNISDTQLSQISTAVHDGIQSGSSASTITDAVNAVINDPARAQLIAITETNRAYNAATTDSFTAAGITQFNWVAYDDACPECTDLADASPYDVGADVPPDHPRCRCYQEAVI